MNALETMQLWAQVISETAGQMDDASLRRRNEALWKAREWAPIAQAEQLACIAAALEKHNEMYAEMFALSGYVEDRPSIDREGYVT